MANEHMQTFTDGNFDQTVLKAGAPVLVDFWAEWCGPCKRIGPTVEALAADYAGKLVVGKMDIDANPRVPEQYQVRSIPTLLVFKSGQVVESLIGAQYSKDDLKKVIDRHI